MTPAPARSVTPQTYQYEESRDCAKVSIGWKLPGKKNRALVELIHAIAAQLAADPSWFGTALIQAGVKTTVWVTRSISGVERAVRANFEAGRLPNAARLVFDLRASLQKTVDALQKGEA